MASVLILIAESRVPVKSVSSYIFLIRALIEELRGHLAIFTLANFSVQSSLLYLQTIQIRHVIHWMMTDVIPG